MAKQDYVTKKREMFSFLPLINNSVTIGLSLLLLSISAIVLSKQLIFWVFCLRCILQYFYKYHLYHSNIQ